MIDYGTGAPASTGSITSATGEALEAEARSRIDSGSYLRHITYASLLARCA
jgi:hypothetical protein